MLDETDHNMERSKGLSAVVRTYWTDVSTPAVAAVVCKPERQGNAVGTRRPHEERGEHLRLYKQGHPKGGVQFECSGRRGSNKKKGSSPPRGVKLSSVQQRRRRFIQNPIK
ncbi:hypothetical protein EVAR_83137_1 [Eumeta japonica]|uniref:Uncharacterized protein n=1 Tax=Eumeta variegata TaxID=151549 RepID=A0A4C1YDU9_EUMVA|nr:hypothetical protein EVAR_83137_1 [Eumeta japonica]